MSVWELQTGLGKRHLWQLTMVLYPIHHVPNIFKDVFYTDIDSVVQFHTLRVAIYTGDTPVYAVEKTQKYPKIILPIE